MDANLVTKIEDILNVIAEFFMDIYEFFMNLIPGEDGDETTTAA